MQLGLYLAALVAATAHAVAASPAQDLAVRSDLHVCTVP